MGKKKLVLPLVCILFSSIFIAVLSSAANDGVEAKVWLHYDNGTSAGAVGVQGVSNDVWLEGAIRLTSTELADYDGWVISSVKFYISPISSAHSGYIQIYDKGTSSSPGALIIAEPFIVSGEGWKEINLPNPNTIDANEDIWVSINIRHKMWEAPLTYDDDAAIAGKEWIKAPILGIDWTNILDFGFGNWMIRAGIEKLNQPPVADAGGSYSGFTDESITLDGSGSYDLDGTIVLYEWDFNSDGIYDWNSTITGITDYIYYVPGDYDATLRVTDDDDTMDTDIATVNITVKDQPPRDDIPAKFYVVLANERIEIKKDTVIKSGDVGANGESDGSVETLTIGKNVKVLDSSSLIKADFIKLQKNAEVQDIYYNYIHKHKTAEILGSEYTPLTLPVATFPPFPDFSSGILDITVKKNDIYIIDEGGYGNINVRQGGKLIFIGGIYNIATLTTAKNVQLIFQDNSEIRIENSLMIGKNNIVGPDMDTSLSASDIIFYVYGEDADNVEAVTVKMNGEINANIYAPNGTIVLKKNIEATGSYIGKNVVMGNNVELTWDSAFQ